MDASILHRKPCLLALLALHLPQPHVPAMLRPNRIKTWHSNYGLRSIKNQKKNNFLLTSVGRSAHTVTMLEPDGDALPPEAAMPACRDGEQLPWGGHHCRR